MTDFEQLLISHFLDTDSNVEFLSCIMSTDVLRMHKFGPALQHWLQGRSQGRVPGVLDPPFWVIKIGIIYITGYNIMRVHKLDGWYEPPVPTSGPASFSRRKPCADKLLCSTMQMTYHHPRFSFDVGVFRWRRKWLNEDHDLPNSAVQACTLR